MSRPASALPDACDLYPGNRPDHQQIRGRCGSVRPGSWPRDGLSPAQATSRLLFALGLGMVVVTG